MITADDVRQRLTETPFQPFRIVASSGSSYDITHPDSVFVSRRVLYVGIYKPQIEGVADRVAHVSVLHVTELVPITEMAGTDPTT